MPVPFIVLMLELISMHVIQLVTYVFHFLIKVPDDKWKMTAEALRMAKVKDRTEDFKDVIHSAALSLGFSEVSVKC